MARPTVILELAGDDALARDLVAGGVFVPGCTVKFNEDCELVVRAGGEEVRVTATVVWVDGTRGAGLQLVGCDAALKQRIAALVARTALPKESGDPTEESGDRTEESGDRTD